ncbi:PKD domain-containing protein [Cellulomonas carbonis]|uniref:PKD domain-containing protein n=1 Tax=Cellulomonas carbonis TaxID=1386092 RepID=UPI0009DEF789|nr:PKD domain-containing protein [Cellulomonas carbonis]
MFIRGTDGRTSRPGTQPDDHVYRRIPVGGCDFGSVSHWTGEEPDRDTLGDGRCVGDDAGLVVRRVCDDGTTGVDPLLRSSVDPATGDPVGDWQLVDEGGCLEEGGAVVVVRQEDLRRLPITPSVPRYQPVDGRGLVGKDLIVYTDPTPQELTTSVLGVPVTVRVTPVRWSWDFGDGELPLVTDSAGAPYPDHTVSRPYADVGTYEVRVTTTWRGEYRVADDGPWLPVTGTATTTSAPFTATVEDAPSRLVADR